jgi:hypothetical protein
MALKPKSHVLRIMVLRWLEDRELRFHLVALAKACQKKIDDRNDFLHGL